LSVAVDKIRAVDFNNDNLTDIVGYSNVFDSDLNKNVMDIVFAKRSANGEFNESHLTPASSVWYIGAIDAADLDADGFADLVTASRESIGDGIRVYKGQASGVFTNTASEFFSTQIATPSGGQPQVISSIHLKDLNDDNKLDIASLYLDDITLVILPNDHVNGSIENPSNLQVNATETGATVALEKGNGNGRIILVREAGENLVAPSGEVFYSANVEYGKGDKIGASFVVMRDNNEGVSITGLKPNTSYVVTAFEYSSTLANTHIQYSSGGVSETFTTLEQQQPITAPSNLNVTATGNTATITLTKGSGSGRIILLRKANEDLTTPVNNVFYTPDAEYGKGSKVGASFVVMRNSSEGAVIIGLTPGVSYVVTAFEYLSDGANTYIEYSDGSVNKTFTTLEEPVDEPDDDEPITGPSNLNVNATETQATVTLTKGTGDGRIILIRKSGETLTIPNDNIFYAANTEYGKGDKIGASFVVMNADLESVVITALTPASSYVVSVFEYSSNASHTHVDYMGALITKTFVTSRDQVDDPGDDPNEEPITAPSNLNVSATETEAIVTLTKGTGDGRIILVRKSNESLTNPTDNMFYTANPAYGEGNKVGTSSVVMRSNNESVLVTGLAPITSYTVTVFEYVAGSNTIAYTNDGVSKTFTTLEDIVLAVEDVATKSFSVSPNPATSIVTIELPAGTIVSELAFYNSIGARFQLPAVHRSDAVEVNVSDLHPGLYVIKLAGTSLKLIKQ
jgi:hypothetical protein